MTSIEWLIKELRIEMNLSGDGRVLDEILEEAKAMHKKEIIDAFSHTEIMSGEYFQVFDNAEEYYKETFKQHKQ